MTHLNSGFVCVMCRTKALQVAQIEGQMRVSAHRLDVIDFQPSSGPAFHATEAITPQGFQSKALPALCACDVFGKAARHDFRTCKS